MRKITLLFALLTTLCWQGMAQTINVGAGWPNAAWTLGGTYTATGLVNDPTVAGTNFTFDDDVAGNGSNDSIYVTSPIIDLTAAHTAGETWINVNGDYVYETLGEILRLEYWDFDANAWVFVGDFAGNNTLNDYKTCSSLLVYSSNTIDISAFTATQLSGFKYRIFYDDLDAWQWGFCFSSPTIVSSTPPSCPAPDTLTVTNITATAADLGWSEMGAAPTWNIEYDTTGFTLGTGTTVAGTTTNPHSLTGLTGATTYQFYVQADCGPDSSTWVGPFSFSTLCGVMSLPWVEDFENAGAIPNCWSMAGAEPWLFNTSGPNHVGNGGTITGTTISNSYYAVVDASGSDTASTLTSPFVDISSLTNPQLSFYEISDNEGFANSALQVEVWDGAAWNDLGTFDVNTNGWEKRELGLTGLTFTGPAQVRFTFSEIMPLDFFDDIAIDDVTFEENNSCVIPLFLSVANITATSADLGWVEQGLASTWNIQYDTSGFTLGTGTVVSGATTNPLTVTGLTGATAYQFYVQADCGADSSIWAGPYSFSTLCGVMSLPWTEDFENAGTIPLCWSMGGGEPWFFNLTGPNHVGNLGVITGTTISNNYYAGVDASGSDPAATLTSPFVDISSLTAPQLSFYEISDNEGGSNSSLGIEVWDGAAWNNLGTFNVNTNGWEKRELGLTGLTFTGPAQVRFTFSEDVPTAFVDDIAIDDVTFEENNSCVVPLFLSAATITASSANLGWTEQGVATTWNIEYDTVGFTIGTGTVVAGTTTNPHSLTGLNSGTAYQFYVQADCGSDSSAWAGPFNFTTIADYCGGDHFYDDGQAAGDYSNGVSDTTVICPAITGNNVSAVFNMFDTESGYDSLFVYDGNSTTDPLLGGFSGNTILPGPFTSTHTSGCLTFVFHSDGGVVAPGWDVSISCAPCVVPTTLTVANITTTSADLGWTEAGSASSWVVEYDTAGFTQGTGTIVAASSNPFSLTGISDTTAYEFYVQADCSIDSSAWAGPFSFTTLSTGIDVNSNDFGVSIYPNPNKGIFTLNVNTANSKDIMVKVMNAQGQIVYAKEDISLVENIDLSQNTKGIYFVNVISNKGVTTHKVIIQ